MDEQKKPFLTTSDNPYNPKTQFADWYRFDTLKGYNTCELLAALAHTSPGLSDIDNAIEEERVIDAVLKLNPTGTYQKIMC